MNRFVVIAFCPEVALDEVPTSSRLAILAAVATPAGIKRQENRITNLNRFIVDVLANAADDTRSLVTKDCRIVTDISKKALLQQDVLW
jgi:hypothetical protein